MQVTVQGRGMQFSADVGIDANSTHMQYREFRLVHESAVRVRGLRSWSSGFPRPEGWVTRSRAGGYRTAAPVLTTPWHLLCPLNSGRVEMKEAYSTVMNPLQIRLASLQSVFIVIGKANLTTGLTKDSYKTNLWKYLYRYQSNNQRREETKGFTHWNRRWKEMVKKTGQFKRYKICITWWIFVKLYY